MGNFDRVIVAFSFHSADVAQLHNLLVWCRELGGCKKHSAVLVADAATPYAECAKARKLALESFGQVYCISNGATAKGWPQGPNSLFWAAAKYIQSKLKAPFLFMETDCVPMKPGWLDLLEAEYKGLDTFMGDFYGGTDTASGLPVHALSGVAVYPPNAASLLKDEPSKPWDMANREYLILNGVSTPLIKHFYGEKDLPPTFVESKAPDAPRNTLALDAIRSQAVLFHRNKDGSLIRLLRTRMGIREHYPITIVFPVCNIDAHLLVANYEWMKELDGHLDYEAVLSCDTALRAEVRVKLNMLGMRLFRSWRQCVYPPPRKLTWPHAPNHAFQNTARAMKKQGQPWLWFEPDAWPLKAGWLDAIAKEYFLRGKEVMGPVVHGMGHVNGVAVYPHNFCDISPRAMKCTDQAWDSVCRPDLDGKIHDASDLFHHAWGEQHGGGFTKWGGIGYPSFKTPDKLTWINPGAVLFHRCKDVTLITQLRNAKNSNLNRVLCEGLAVSAV